MSRTWKVVLVFIAVFLAGAVAGGFATFRFAPPPKVLKKTQLDQFGIIQMKRLTEQLVLTEEQRERIKPLVNRASAEMRIIRLDGLRATTAVLEQMEEVVSKELNEKQRIQFLAMQAQQRERMKEILSDRRHEGTGPDGRPPKEPRVPPAPAP